MHINLETAGAHAIQAYDNAGVQINAVMYQRSLIVSATEIITDWKIKSVEELEIAQAELLLKLKPELIIIGHTNTSKFPPMSSIALLSKHRVGIECMSIGAASRTYNVLLSEHRAVVAGFIYP